MPHSNIVEWVAGGTLPQQRRRKVRTAESMPQISVNVEDETSDSSCCSTCSSCSSSCSVASVNLKKVHFKPKGILKNAKEVEKEKHKCCSACTPKSHCNERHTIGKNGKVYGSNKKCAPKNGRNATNSNSSKKARSKNNNNSSKSSISSSTHTIHRDRPQTPEERQTAQHLSSLINRNMSRLILPSRAEVIIREDVIENPSDPRPNAFFDARTGILRVYHGPVYGNPGGSLVPLQAQHVPIGTRAAPTSSWNPWAGMMGGMMPTGINQQGGGNFGMNQQGGGNFGQQGNAGGNSNSSNRNNSSGKPQASDTDAKGSSDDTGGSRRMPGSFHNDDDQNNGNSGLDNKNKNDDTWGVGNDSSNNNSSSNDAGPSNDTPADVWAGDDDNNASSGNDDWGPGGNDSSNNNASSGNDDWGQGGNDSSNNNASSGNNEWGPGGNDSSNNNASNNEWRGGSNNNSSNWQSSNNNNNNNYPNPTATVMSAGSWGDNGQGPTTGGNGNNWSKPAKQESWGDASAAQSTKPADETSGW